MKPRIKVITVGVDDLEKSLAFYRDGLGLPTQGIIGTEFEDGAVAFFNLNDDLILALYPRAALAKDAKIPVSPPSP
ncbi:MAG: VOC family protein, partial [Thermoleophilia bacterium]|nr:VOC family protein [Thermoleophilia bacterium]